MWYYAAWQTSPTLQTLLSKTSQTAWQTSQAGQSNQLQVNVGRVKMLAKRPPRRRSARLGGHHSQTSTRRPVFVDLDVDTSNPAQGRLCSWGNPGRGGMQFRVGQLPPNTQVPPAKVNASVPPNTQMPLAKANASVQKGKNVESSSRVERMNEDKKGKQKRPNWQYGRAVVMV